MSQTPQVILTSEGALQYLIDRQADLERNLLAAIQALREDTVAVNQGVQDALNRLSGEISDLGDSVDRALAAANTTNDTLRTQIAALEGMVTELQADDNADAAMISQLQATIAALQSAQTEQESAVIASLDSLTTALDSIDERVDAAGGATPDPEPEPEPEPAPEEPAPNPPTPEEPTPEGPQARSR